MANRLAVVFGGSGFIGRHLVQRLAAEGWRVRVPVRDPEGAAFLKPLGDVGQVVPVYANVTKDDSVKAAVQNADLVVNLVGVLYEGGKQTFKALHEDAVGRIAAAAKAAGAQRLIHLSALGADAASESAYARSKAAGEAAVLAAFPEATILRPSVVFGPEDDFFNGFVQLATYSPALPVFVADGFKRKGFGIDLYGSGGTKFQPVYVGDVAQAAVNSLASDAAKGKVFELGGPTVYSFKQLLELALKSAGRCRLIAPAPFFAAKIVAGISGFARACTLGIMKPLLTADQVKLLGKDNVVSEGAAGLEALGVTPTAAEVILPTYLSRFKNPYIHRQPA
jgi:NADH dehydrogenase